MSRKLGGRGLKSLENEQKNTKIKAAVKLYCNADPTMAAVRQYIKDAKKYAEELDLQLWLNFPNPTAITDSKKVEGKKVKQAIYKAHQHEIQSTVSEERWQGKLINNRWDDEKVKLEGFFAQLSSWKNAPTHTIAGVKSVTNSYQLPRFTTTEKQNHKKIKLMKNAAYEGIPWRMCTSP